MEQKRKPGRPYGTARVGKPPVGQMLIIPCEPKDHRKLAERHRGRARMWGLKIVTRASKKHPGKLLVWYMEI